MDKLIQDLHSNLERAKQLVKENEIVKKQQESQQYILDRREAKVKEVESALSEREFHASKVENVVDLKKQNELMSAKLQEEYSKLEQEKQDFTRYRDSEEARLSSLRDSIKKESHNVEVNRKAHEDRVSKFEQEVDARVNEITSKFKIKR